MNNILIYGPSSIEKASFGKNLANTLKMSFFDLEEQIKERTNDSPDEIALMLGKDNFNKVEADIFEDLVFTYDNSVIVLMDSTLQCKTSEKIALLENKVICINSKKCKDLNKRMHYMSFKDQINIES